MKTKEFKIIMLATDKVTNNVGDIILSTQGLGLARMNVLTTDSVQPYVNQHLYIISDDEIKEGDWYINPNKSGIYQCINIVEGYRNEKFIKINDYISHELNDSKKIVATTNKLYPINKRPDLGALLCISLPQIPESFISAYIKAYNEGNKIEEVNLEIINSICDCFRADHHDPCEDVCSSRIYKIKTRSDNTVIIHQSKIYTRDEIILAYKASFYQDFIHGKYGSQDENVKFNQWIEENL